MPASLVNQGATRIADDVFRVSYLAGGPNIAEGCVVVYGATDDEVTLPPGANAGRIAGVSMSAGPLTAGVGGVATAQQDRVSVQKFGRARVLLAAGQTATRGQTAVVANAQGHVQARAAGSTTAGKVGKFAQTKTAGANADMVEVDLELGDAEVVQLVTGAAATTFQAATKFLAAPGTGAASATPVPLTVVPQAGVIRNLSVVCTTAPGGADTDAFTVQKSSDNGATWVDTALTATVTGAAKAAADTSDTPAVAAGDLLAVKVVASATSLGAGRVASFQIA